MLMLQGGVLLAGVKVPCLGNDFHREVLAGLGCTGGGTSVQRHGARVWCAIQHLWRTTVVRLAQGSTSSTSDADMAMALARVHL
ncbi:hypothetical protein B296_00022797 [Ensete ventricosum]|uniref:Uncharacterized protein n=1 Tax=Ensete ventricosum TaxID=4639 RepID=A0A426ZFE6_ENSVE|nr:hypothetical protein B296_00022797 [Ensete ventricosum]